MPGQNAQCKHKRRRSSFIRELCYGSAFPLIGMILDLYILSTRNDGDEGLLHGFYVIRKPLSKRLKGPGWRGPLRLLAPILQRLSALGI